MTVLLSHEQHPTDLLYIARPDLIDVIAEFWPKIAQSCRVRLERLAEASEISVEDDTPLGEIVASLSESPEWQELLAT